MDIPEVLFWVLCGSIALPVIVFLCLKFGVVGYYKGKEFIKEQRSKSGTSEK